MRVVERTLQAEAAGRRTPPEGDEVGQFKGRQTSGPKRTEAEGAGVGRGT